MPIYMCITVNGKRADMSAGRDCDPAKWNSHSGRAIGTKEEIKSLNNLPDYPMLMLRRTANTKQNWIQGV